MKRLAKYLALAMLAALPATSARAVNVTFAVIGPHEYELPVNFKDFDVFVQYGFANFSNQTFDAHGNTQHIPNQDFNLGLTKFVRFITFDGLPNVGFAPEAIIPEAQINNGNGSNIYGIADPIFGGAVWVKPNKNSTFGFQTFIQAPIGTSNLTNHYYDNITTIFYDYQARTWDLTGNTGGVFRANSHQNGVQSVAEGTTFFTDLRLGYKLNQPSIPIEPFVAVDYEFTTGSRNAATGAPPPPTFVNGQAIYSNTSDLALGAGGVITISDKYSLTLRYSRSVYGLNEVPTNAVYMKFVSILP